MDPPSYGRGPGGEVWQLEEHIYHLVSLCAELLSEQPLLFLLNSYTTGLSPSVMAYLLGITVQKEHRGIVTADEIGLLVASSGYVLPCGSTAIFRGE
jgi:23S rRNA (cytosine1962-C5)-methyltransferase